ncbi:MAG TPA: hypothetical protein PKA84_10285, partial [Rubrivivax sp.]|nr:hypothetical protein [Rubrivivax sp.]
MLAQRTLEVAGLGAVGIALCAQALDLRVQPRRILRQQREPLVEQIALEAGEEKPQHIAGVAQALGLRPDGG